MSPTQCIYACTCCEDDLLKFKPSIKMGKKGGLGDFECGMVAGGVLRKLLICWDFNTQPALGFAKNGQKKKRMDRQ